MRSLFYVALVIAVLTNSDAVAATAKSNQAQLSSKTTPDYGVLTQESHSRFLRVNREEDDEPTSLLAVDEERVKVSGLNKVAKELKLRNEKQKKLAAALAKAKVSPQGQRLAAAAKRMKVKAKPQTVPGSLNTVEFQRFSRIFKSKKNTPEQVKQLGLFKNLELLEKYKTFYNVMKTKV